MYVHKECLPGWYMWTRSWGREPTYAYIDDGIVAVKWRGDVEYMGVLPNNYEEFDWLDTEDDVLGIMTDDFIRSVREQGGQLRNVSEFGSTLSSWGMELLFLEFTNPLSRKRRIG